MRVLLPAAVVFSALNIGLMVSGTFPFDMVTAWQDAAFGHRFVGIHTAVCVALLLLELAPLALWLRWRARRTRSGALPVAVDGSDGLWLEHHDIHARALRYDPGTGAAMPAQRPEVPVFARGAFVNIPGGVAGVYASPAGPVFFIDAEQFVLDGDFRLRVETGRLRNVASLYRGEALLRQLSYAPPADVGVGLGDGFDTSFDRDFFVWLSDSLADGSLFPYFTGPWPWEGRG
jgi:hypothetical protein